METPKENKFETVLERYLKQMGFTNNIIGYPEYNGGNAKVEIYDKNNKWVWTEHINIWDLFMFFDCEKELQKMNDKNDTIITEQVVNSVDNACEEKINTLLAKIRQAVADYICTEGCSCCQDRVGHEKAMKRLGKLLKMEMYSDGSGFDYRKYKSNK